MSGSQGSTITRTGWAAAAAVTLVVIALAWWWQIMKRSNAPVFWLLFGAGGMLSALFGTVLVFITGIAAPLGWQSGPNLMSYRACSPFAQNWIGKGFLFAVIALFAWHAVHRIYHSLHDVGVPLNFWTKLVCYGTRAGDHGGRRCSPAVDRLLSFAHAGEARCNTRGKAARRLAATRGPAVRR